MLVDELLKKFCDYKKILYCEETNEIMVLNLTYDFNLLEKQLLGLT
ncbi:hypothetical protein [Clostridium estertheticum]|nr:hypothetical protein [Clostridium estertheticum]MBX4258446.1 hypothetical protein [Clostridium estertheticum]